MNSQLIARFFFFLFFCIANASANTAHKLYAGFLFGAGTVDIEYAGDTRKFDTLSAGFQVGYKFKNWLAAEYRLEAYDNLFADELANVIFETIFGESVEIIHKSTVINSLGLAVRSSGKFYLKGKLGASFIYNEFDVNSDSSSQDIQRTNMTYHAGVGLGVRNSVTHFELELIKHGEDIDSAMFSFGVTF